MVKPIEANGEFNLKGAFKAGMSVDVGGGKKVKFLHCSSSGVNGFEFLAKNWSLGAMSNKDAHMEFRKDMDMGKLKIRQIIPKGDFHLAPSPVVTLATKPKKFGKFQDEYELSYDFLTRIGRVTEFLEFNKTVGVKVTANTKDGASGAMVTLSTKLKQPWCKLVGVSNSPRTGAIAFYEAEPSKCLDFKGDYVFSKKEMTASLGMKFSAQSRTKLKVNARFGKEGPMKPALNFGVNIDMK